MIRSTQTTIKHNKARQIFKVAGHQAMFCFLWKIVRSENEFENHSFCVNTFAL